MQISRQLCSSTVLKLHWADTLWSGRRAAGGDGHGGPGRGGVLPRRHAAACRSRPAPRARVPAIPVDFDLCHPHSDGMVPDPAMQPRYHDPEEEIALGAWLARGWATCR